MRLYDRKSGKPKPRPGGGGGLTLTQVSHESRPAQSAGPGAQPGRRWSTQSLRAQLLGPRARTVTGPPPARVLTSARPGHLRLSGPSRSRWQGPATLVFSAPAGLLGTACPPHGAQCSAHPATQSAAPRRLGTRGPACRAPPAPPRQSRSLAPASPGRGWPGPGPGRTACPGRLGLGVTLIVPPNPGGRPGRRRRRAGGAAPP